MIHLCTYVSISIHSNSNRDEAAAAGWNGWLSMDMDVQARTDQPDVLCVCESKRETCKTNSPLQIVSGLQFFARSLTRSGISSFGFSIQSFFFFPLLFCSREKSDLIVRNTEGARVSLDFVARVRTIGFKPGQI